MGTFSFHNILNIDNFEYFYELPEFLVTHEVGAYATRSNYLPVTKKSPSVFTNSLRKKLKMIQNFECNFKNVFFQT